MKLLISPAWASGFVPISFSTDHVTARDAAVEPGRLELAPGGVVRWGNDDSVTHAVEFVQCHAWAEYWGHGTVVPAAGATQLDQCSEAGIYECESSLHGGSRGEGSSRWTNNPLYVTKTNESEV